MRCVLCAVVLTNDSLKAGGGLDRESQICSWLHFKICECKCTVMW